MHTIICSVKTIQGTAISHSKITNNTITNFKYCQLYVYLQCLWIYIFLNVCQNQPQESLCDLA